MTPEEIAIDAAEHERTLAKVRRASRRYLLDDVVTPPAALPKKATRERSRSTSRQAKAREAFERMTDSIDQ